VKFCNSSKLPLQALALWTNIFDARTIFDLSSRTNKMASNGTPTRIVVTECGDSAVVMNTSTSGNLSFEYVLSPARVGASPRAPKFQSPVVASPRSLDEIAAKLKAAEENRGRLLDEKLEKIKEHEKHVAEVRKLSFEMQAEAQKKLDNSLRKLAVAEELRQQRVGSLVEKLKEHDNHIVEVRKRLSNKGDSNGDALQRELDDATANRDMVADAIQEKQQNFCCIF